MFPSLVGIDFLDPVWLIRWFGALILLGDACVVFIERGFI
ncbi:MAG: hypothetical protein JWM51_871, partial [Microbacteriaceae bacterium]|nr:hypothetical protein [Microbacteriaceae bacterium]